MTDSGKKIAMVTGASRGLGAALAFELAQRGFHVIAVAKTVGALEELDDRITEAGGSATLVPVDLCEEGALPHICRSIYDRWGKVDLLCHAAIHAAPLCPADQIDGRDLKKSIENNVTLTARVIENVAPLLKASENGAAVFFDDAAAGEKFHATYGMTKRAQITMARAWQAEAVKTGPAVHIVTPAPMPTATRARFHPGEDRSNLQSCEDAAKGLLDEVLG